MTVLHRQIRFDDVLPAANRVLRDLGRPAYVAALMPQGVSGLWRVQRVIGPDGLPAVLDELPEDAFDLTLDADPIAGALEALLLRAVDAAAGKALAERTGIASGVMVPVHAAGGIRGAYLALLGEDGDPNAVVDVLVHAAIAAERILNGGSGGDSATLLAPQAFQERCLNELGRAKRYDRLLAIVLARPDGARGLYGLGEALASRVRLWDAVGVVSTLPPTLGVLLPETGREGALGFFRRVGPGLGAATLGAAVFPQDALAFDRLREIAGDRLQPLPAFDPLAGASGATRWLRWAPAGTGPETVSCPRCRTEYSHADGTPVAGAAEALRQAAIAWLAAHCPHHDPLITVELRSEREHEQVAEPVVGGRRAVRQFSPYARYRPSAPSPRPGTRPAGAPHRASILPANR